MANEMRIDQECHRLGRCGWCGRRAVTVLIVLKNIDEPIQVQSLELDLPCLREFRRAAASLEWPSGGGRSE